MKQKLTTFEKLLIKIQTGDWDDLAYLSIKIEENCFTGKDIMTKNDLEVQEKLLSLIEERKAEMFKHKNLTTRQLMEIEDIEPRLEFQNF